MAGKNKPNELYLTRVFDAPVKLVWEAWTDPQQIAQWWGPRGFTHTTKSKDLRPGGKWIYTMHGPDGTDWPNIATYYEVEKYKRLVYDHGGNEERQRLFHVTVNFIELQGGKTKLEFTMAFDTPEAARETKKFIKQASGDSTWDRLAEFLDQAAGKNTFVINRTFHASLDLMFEMWADPEHLAKWLPPTGFRMEILRGAEVKDGAEIFYRMSDGASTTMYGNIRYLEVRRPHLLVSTQQFTDENGKISRHPKMPLWPETLLRTVTFTEDDPGHVRVKVQWEPHGKVSAAELQAFLAFRPSMTQGWTGSFDKLEALLE